MIRITTKMLEMKVSYLNKITGSPATAWTRYDDLPLKANVGNFHLSRGNVGVRVERMISESGAISIYPIGNHSYIPKREMLDILESFINGIEFCQDELTDPESGV